MGAHRVFLCVRLGNPSGEEVLAPTSYLAGCELGYQMDQSKVFTTEDTRDRMSKAPPLRLSGLLSYSRKLGGQLWSELPKPYRPTPDDSTKTHTKHLPQHTALHDADTQNIFVG